MARSAEGDASDAPLGNSISIEPGAKPKGRPGRKPKGSVPAVVTEMPDQPDPNHVLTWRQRKVLQVIKDSVQRRGYPPSMREIGEAVGLTSTSSVSYQLSTLQSKGYLRRDAGTYIWAPSSSAVGTTIGPSGGWVNRIGLPNGSRNPQSVP